MIIQPDLKEELLEEQQQQTGDTDEVGLSEVNINIQGEVIQTLVDMGSEISVISDTVLDRIKENTRTTLPVMWVTIVGVLLQNGIHRMQVVFEKIGIKTRVAKMRVCKGGVEVGDNINNTLGILYVL